MNVYRWNEMTEDEKRDLLRRSEKDISELEDDIRLVVEAVRDMGDSAVARFTMKFDGVAMKSSQFRVKKMEFAEAQKKLPAKVRQAIEKAAANVRKYH